MVHDVEVAKDVLKKLFLSLSVKESFNWWDIFVKENLKNIGHLHGIKRSQFPYFSLYSTIKRIVGVLKNS